MEPEKPSPTVAATAPAPPRGYVEMGYLFAAAGAFLFSTKAIAIKLAYEEPVDAATLLALRMAMALPFYAVGSSRVDLQACKLEYSIVSPK